MQAKDLELAAVSANELDVDIPLAAQSQKMYVDILCTNLMGLIELLSNIWENSHAWKSSL